MVGLARNIVLVLVSSFLLVLPVRAADEVERLGRALFFEDVAEILREEGLDYGRSLDEDMLGGYGGAHFARQIADIYDAGRMLEVLYQKLAASMTAQEIEESLAFLETPMGERIMRLEVTARQAMSDEAVTQIAKESFAAAEAKGEPRLEMIARFIEINDLIDHNVAGALSSNYRFLAGLTDGGGARPGEGQTTDDVWAQEPEIRRDTTEWMNGFLFMAYGPLEDAELQAYLDFCETPAGQSLNEALFMGFDAVYDRIYYEIGQTVARAMQARDL